MNFKLMAMSHRLLHFYSDQEKSYLEGKLLGPRVHGQAAYEVVHKQAVYKVVHKQAVYKVVHKQAVYKVVHKQAVYKVVHNQARHKGQKNCFPKHYHLC
jgi:hypothetical protein